MASNHQLVTQRQGLPVECSVAAGTVPLWGVQALLLAAGDALAARFAAVAVCGELSSFTRAASGHCYFTLKDATGAVATLRCAMFRRAAQWLEFAPRDGQQVELRGRLALYEARGELQMIVEAMRGAGAGALYEEFLRLRERLAAQGLFDAARKRPLPLLPRRVALVTSADGAALHDVLTTLRRRSPQVEVVLSPAPVQGAQAAAALAAALAQAGAHSRADLIILCRGGGALEDLWAFNDERVVRAVAASPLPVVCGVGHETDITLADLAADVRAATPTAAAELAAPARDDLLAALDALAARLAGRMRWRLDAQAQRLDTLALHLQRPGRAVAAQALRLHDLAGRWRAALRRHLDAHAHAQAAIAQRLEALDPAHVLARGYVWMHDATGRPVPRARGLHAGQTLHAVWADGQAAVAVQSVSPRSPNDTLPLTHGAAGVLPRV